MPAGAGVLRPAVEYSFGGHVHRRFWIPRVAAPQVILGQRPDGSEEDDLVMLSVVAVVAGIHVAGLGDYRHSPPVPVRRMFLPVPDPVVNAIVAFSAAGAASFDVKRLDVRPARIRGPVGPASFGKAYWLAQYLRWIIQLDGEEHVVAALGQEAVVERAFYVDHPAQSIVTDDHVAVHVGGVGDIQELD